MMKYDYIILGGGWTGIITSIEIKKIYPNAKIAIIDKSNFDGGLLRSERINNHIFDTGGSHIIFSRNKEILDRILSLIKNNYVQHRRKAFVLINDTFIPYPFENGIYKLPKKERFEIVVSFLKAYMNLYKNHIPKNLEEWIYNFFGDWIAKNYLIPYNEKIWKRPLKEIDVDWLYIPGRLPIPNWEDVVASAIGIKTIGYKEQSTFYYPKYGGIQTLYNSALEEAKKMDITFISNEKVEKIDKKDEIFIINNKFETKKIINTIPLPELLKALKAPEEILNLVNKLEYNKVIVVGLALKKKAPKHHWIYVPDKKIIFHRYAWISNYSPYNSPKGESTIIAEITTDSYSNVDLGKIEERVVSDFERLEILKSEEIILVKSWINQYGYPLYIKGHRESREKILQWLKDENILSIGRWGSWHYWNIDKIYENVIELVKNI